MKTQFLALFILIFFGFAGELLAQRIIRGTVEDANNLSPLQAAHLVIEGATDGTVTNRSGGFELRLLQLPTTVHVRYIGYESKTIVITDETPRRLTIQLQPAVLQLEELVITDENPAYNIMRNVIKRKAEWFPQIGQYEANGFSRFTLENDREIVQITESLSQIFWRAGEGSRELVYARRRRPDGDKTFRFASTIPAINLYDDNILVGEFNLVGPTHPDAPDIYTFTLGENRMYDGRLVYEIYFRPTDPKSSAFVGRVSVLAQDWIILEMHLRPNRNSILPPPVKSWGISLRQQFRPWGDLGVVPVDLHVIGHVDFGVAGVNYPPAKYSQITQFTSTRVGAETPDSLFAQDQLRVIDEVADYRDQFFDYNPLVLPMTPKEVVAVQELDDRGLRRAFRAGGLLRNYAGLNLEDEAEREARKKENISWWPRPQVWYNRVEGYHFGIEKSLRLNRSWLFEAGGAFTYALNDTLDPVGKRYDLLGSAGGTYFLGANKNLFVSGLASKMVNPIGGETVFPRWQAGVFTWLGSADPYDYYQQNKLHFSAGYRIKSLKTTVTGFAFNENDRAMIANSSYLGWFWGDGQRENPEITDSEYNGLGATLHLGFDDRFDAKEPDQPQFLKLTYTQRTVQHADKNFFWTLAGEAEFSVPTFFRRRTWPSRLNLRLTGSWSPEKLPFQHFAGLETRIDYYETFGAFNSLNGSRRLASNHFAVYWEHDFGTALFETLGLWGLANAGFGFAVHGASGWLNDLTPAWDEDRLASLNLYDGTVKNYSHHEIGVSLKNLFGHPINLSVTRGLVNQKGWHFGFSFGR